MHRPNEAGSGNGGCNHRLFLPAVDGEFLPEVYNIYLSMMQSPRLTLEKVSEWDKQ
jgi:hypothetical protein